MDQDKGLPDSQALGQATRKVFIQSMDHSALQQEEGSTNIPGLPKYIKFNWDQTWTVDFYNKLVTKQLIIHLQAV